MQAVILAAGKGTRLGEITQNIPKPLVLVRGKPILEYTLGSLPSTISEAIIVVNHLSEKIRRHFGRVFGKIPLRYVEQSGMAGTAGALWAAKESLEEPFLVLNGDDFYSTPELEILIAEGPAMGLTPHRAPTAKYLAIELGKDSVIAGFHKAAAGEEILLVNGAYVLTGHIFDYAPHAIPNGEYGLPQTILDMARETIVQGIIMKHWFSVNYPEDIRNVELRLTKR